MYAYYYRRLFQAVIILSLFEFNLFQIMLTMALNLFQASLVLAFRPFKNSGEQNLEVMNEVMLLLTIYFMVCFLPDFIEGEQRENAGIGIVAITSVSFLGTLITVCMLLKLAIRRAYIKCKSIKLRGKVTAKIHAEETLGVQQVDLSVDQTRCHQEAVSVWDSHCKAS